MRNYERGSFDPIFIGAIVAVMSIGGFVIWQISSSNDESSTVSNSENGLDAENEVGAQNNETDMIDEKATTRETKKHAAEELGISFIHDAEWSLVDEDGNAENGVLVTLLPDDTGTEIWLQNYILGSGPKEESIFSAAGVDYSRTDGMYITYRDKDAVEGQANLVEVWIRPSEGAVAADYDSDVMMLLESVEQL